MYMWRPENNHRGQSSPSYYLRQNLLLLTVFYARLVGLRASWESPASTHFNLLREFWGYRHTLLHLAFRGLWSSNPGPDALLSRSFTPWAHTPAWNVESLG